MVATALDKNSNHNAALPERAAIQQSLGGIIIPAQKPKQVSSKHQVVDVTAVLGAIGMSTDDKTIDMESYKSDVINEK